MHPQKHTGKGGKIVAEYDPLSKKVTQLYSMREMVLYQKMNEKYSTNH